MSKEKHEYTFKPTILGDARARKKMLSYAMQKMEDKAARSFIQDTIASASKQRAASEKPPGASAQEPTPT